ncbi:MAG: hypothetical protein ACLU38_16340, partial [Dysosmobacter sp.]
MSAPPTERTVCWPLACLRRFLHGHNKLMKELICDHPDRYQYFQFSILQILPKTLTDDEVIHTKSLWKEN